jgi:membrane associated rhomboid family serine protease
MLDDRHYIRNASQDSGRSTTLILIIVLVVAFVVQSFADFYAHLPVYDWFALSLDGFKHKRFWQLLTFQFMHFGPWPFHLIFNCIGLYFLGRSVEETLGRKSFLTLYFLSGFFGASLQLITTWLLPNHPDGPVVGASAGVMGLLATYAVLFPMREMTIFVYFFPLTLRVQYLFWASLFLSAFGTFIPYGGIAHAAHLGGLLMGLAYIRWGDRARQRFAHWHPFQTRQRKRELVKAAFVGVRRPRLDESQDLPSEEFISKEVDPILDKISAHGIQSLTERERRILEAARAKMSKH